MIELWAEAGPCDKSIDKALEFAKKAYEAGASALKVQWFNPEAIFAPNASRYDKTGGSATTQNEAAANPIYPYQLWKPVIEYCSSQNLRFIPSVFDLEAVEVADEFGLPVLKIASGDLTYHELLRKASQRGQVALSTGAATMEEVARAVDQLDDHTTHILMACHLEYPTPYERANVARTYALQANFPHLVPGFSDHTPGIDTIPLMVAAGCQVIEKHFTLKAGQGYDSDFGLTPDQLRNAVLKIGGTVAVMGNADIEPDADEMAAREGARRSPYAAREIQPGDVLSRDDIVILRPHYGLEPDEAYRLVGRSFDMTIPKHGKFPS